MKLRKNITALAAAACFLLGVNASEAAVTLTFAQSGPNVTATWSGTFALPEIGTLSLSPTSGAISQTTAAGRSGELDRVSDAGFGVVTPTSIISVVFGTYSGATFGFGSSGNLVYPDLSGVYSPSGVFFFAATSLSDIGASTFNNTLAFTGTGNVGGNREIRFQTIPEPSSILLLGLGASCLVSRRQRKHTV